MAIGDELTTAAIQPPGKLLMNLLILLVHGLKKASCSLKATLYISRLNLSALLLFSQLFIDTDLLPNQN